MHQKLGSLLPLDVLCLDAATKALTAIGRMRFVPDTVHAENRGKMYKGKFVEHIVCNGVLGGEFECIEAACVMVLDQRDSRDRRAWKITSVRVSIPDDKRRWWECVFDKDNPNRVRITYPDGSRESVTLELKITRTPG